MPPPAKRSGPAARPSSANGGSSTVPSPTAWRKPVTGSSPSRVCRQVSGAACAPPMPLSDCTRSSSEGSRPRPCCHRPIPPPCCSGHCSLPDRSTCARSMAGKRPPPSQSISRLTSPHDQIPSSCWRSRRGNSYHIPDGTRRQKTEDRRQKTEDRRQKTEDRRQKTEDRRQKTEDRRQKTEDRR